MTQGSVSLATNLFHLQDGILCFRLQLPHILNRNGATELEDGANRQGLKTALEGLGHQVTLGPIDSGQQGIKVVNGKLTGGGDRRREGVALGD